MKPQHIAIVIGDFGMPGGAEKVAADLAYAFDQQGHRVTLITFEEKQKSGYLQPPGQHLHVSMPSRDGSALRQIGSLLQRAWVFRRIIQHHHFDRVFAFLDSANLPCALASKQVALSVHIDPDEWSKRQTWLIRKLYPRARRVIAVSNPVKAKLEAKAGLHNVTRIYNPVNRQRVAKLAQQPLPELELPTTPFILAVGRFDRLKRFDRLIRAYALSGLKGEVRLIILGEGPLRPQLEAQVAQAGLQEWVHLPGYASNPYVYMQRALFQVLSSDSEAYPLVLVEALSLGCPVIATDCPSGPREIIQHQHNGLLVALDEGEALGQAMRDLVNQPILRQQLAAQAPASVSGNDLYTVAQAWLAA